jgi:hypothetical protein
MTSYRSLEPRPAAHQRDFPPIAGAADKTVRREPCRISRPPELRTEEHAQQSAGPDILFEEHAGRLRLDGGLCGRLLDRLFWHHVVRRGLLNSPRHAPRYRMARQREWHARLRLRSRRPLGRCRSPNGSSRSHRIYGGIKLACSR